MQKTVDYQSELSHILSRKAVGPKGSRHLAEKNLDIIIPALESADVSLESKAVLVASVITLERNELEERLLKQWKGGGQFLPDTLGTLFFGESDSEFHFFLKKILRGEDLSESEASTAVLYLLNNEIPDYQKGVFLIGERLKRESFEENNAFLQAMRQVVKIGHVDVPVLLDLADPYDGFRRYPIYTPFLASLLAAMGIPAYCHGLREVAPKYGNTIHKMLDLAGKNPLKSVDSVVEELETDSVGWGYIDQSVYFPAMHDLQGLRDKIVKRPFLATLEKLLQPLRSDYTNYMVTGYVHSHYKQELTNLLKNRRSLDGFFIVKGMEGATQIDFRKESDNIVVREGKSNISEVEGQQIRYPKEEWDACTSLVEYTLETGTAALKGTQNTAREILVNQVHHIVGSLNINIIDATEARLQAQQVIDSGRAFRHWENGCK